MSFQPNHGFRNLLTRRIRRHSSLATLFRAPSNQEPVYLMDTHHQTLTAPDALSGVVQATWSGVERAEPVKPMPLPTALIRAQTGGSSPESRPIAQPSASVAGLTTDDQQTINKPLPGQSPELAGLSKSSVSVSISRTPAPSMPAEAAPVIPARTPEMESESGISDSVWRRLQTIFKRHQNTSNASHKDAQPEQVPASEQTISTPAETPHAQQRAVQTEVGTSNPSPTTSSTNSTPGSPASIQRSSQIQKEPVPQQLPSEPVTQTEGYTASPIPALSTHIAIPTGSGTRAPDLAITFTSEQPEPEYSVSRPSDADEIKNEIINNSIDEGVEPHPLAPFPGSNATAPLRGQEKLATPIEHAISKSPERVAPNPVREPSEMHQTDTPSMGEYNAPTFTPSPPLSQIQRVTAPLDKPDAPPPTQENVRDAHSPVIQSTDKNTPTDAEPFPEDSMREQQHVPLQEAWHVERLTGGTPASEPTTARGFVRQSANSYDSAIQKSISRVLNNVAAGHPTSSSIEVVAPRHPRPVPMPGSGRVQRAAIVPDSGPVQDRQHRAVRIQENNLPVGEDVVDTAIGPLPADLWTLIDEPVPPTVRRQPSIPHTTPVSSPEFLAPAKAGTQMRTTNRHNPENAVTDHTFLNTGGQISRRLEPGTETFSPERTVISPAPKPVSQHPTYIQRVADSSDTGTQTGSVEQNQTTNPEETSTGQEQEQSPAGSGVDIDDLAQKVYAEVKRKITVEWERLRTRF